MFDHVSITHHLTVKQLKPDRPDGTFLITVGFTYPTRKEHLENFWKGDSHVKKETLDRENSLCYIQIRYFTAS